MGESDLGGSSKGDFVNIRVIGEGGTCGGSVAWDHVNDARWDPDLLTQRYQVEARQGALFRGLHDHGTATGQGGSDLPGKHSGWVIPLENGGKSRVKLMEILEFFELLSLKYIIYHELCLKSK